jgi:hypothetical protein
LADYTKACSFLCAECASPKLETSEDKTRFEAKECCFVQGESDSEAVTMGNGQPRVVSRLRLGGLHHRYNLAAKDNSELFECP